MLKRLILTALFLYSGILYSQDYLGSDKTALDNIGRDNIELVESIPIETSLDNPDIRNTPEVWLEMINSAQKSLDFEEFYVSNEKGEALDTILNAIVAAANRGVLVRIIIDGGMYRTYPNDVEWLEQQSPNIVKHVIDFKNLAGGIQHSKFFIADDREIFLGSQNFDWRSLRHIHELGVRCTNESVVIPLRNIFAFDWSYCERDDGISWKTDTSIVIAWRKRKNNIFSKLYDTVYTSLVSSPKNYIIENWDITSIINIINNANSQINLQFLSYNVNTKEGYWSEVDSALINASERGVKVKLIVSDWNLSKGAVEHFKELIAHPNIEVRYTVIPEYSVGFIPYARVEHCKFITADSVCWIGTSNMSKDYFYNSRNVGIVVENKKFAQRVRDIFYKSWNSEYANPIEVDGVYEPRKRDW